MKWLFTVGLVALGIAFLWYMGVLQAVGGAFMVWLRWIGAR
jgi:hypothetical protein